MLDRYFPSPNFTHRPSSKHWHLALLIVFVSGTLAFAQSLPTDYMHIARDTGTYLVADDEALSYYLAVPQDADGYPRPLVVLLHGGAFYTGSPNDDDVRLLEENFLAAGYATARISYRVARFDKALLLDRCGWRASQDASAALRYFHQHADRFGVSRDFIFIGGVSAGAYASVMAGCYDDGEPLRGRERILESLYGGLHAAGNQTLKPVQPAAVFSIGGGVLDLNMLDLDDPYIYGAHGGRDAWSPVHSGKPKLLGFERLDLTIDDVNAVPKVYGPQAWNNHGNSRVDIYPDREHALIFSRRGMQTSVAREIAENLVSNFNAHLPAGVSVKVPLVVDSVQRYEPVLVPIELTQAPAESHREQRDTFAISLTARNTGVRLDRRIAANSKTAVQYFSDGEGSDTLDLIVVDQLGRVHESLSIVVPQRERTGLLDSWFAWARSFFR